MYFLLHTITLERPFQVKAGLTATVVKAGLTATFVKDGDNTNPEATKIIIIYMF